ncbi:uncharacterized protein LOC134663544 [Cydia fagiglandana]|uniref:uncharacterized protein LOC134663544 n=1 Tax=Cydia fagiglandana TaxID=1458189 RepID=UPI002FEE3C3D
MLSAFALWHVGLLVLGVDGLIEIVEEQQCHDYAFRLTCRQLDAHIAILEAWYTSTDHLNSTDLTSNLNLTIKTENDSELDRVYVYSSPKHNGVYESNHSNFENLTSVNVSERFEFSNETDFLEVNGSDCGVGGFLRSYGSWREGDKRRRSPSREAAVNLRAPVSYRCTGVNHCSFVLREDYPPARGWPAGVVYIKYACFDDTLSIHYCNREVAIGVSGPASEGYIRTPGYPNFYVGDECRWKLVAHPEQRIRISLLDVSLRSIGPFENECSDYVLVTDGNGDALLSSCDQVALPLRLSSATNAVHVTVETRSEGAYPKRGVLFHYKSIGCVTLPAPSDGYLVYRNEDVAHYMCNVRHVFADTRQRARVIWCFDDNRWNDTVPLCVEEASDLAGEGKDKNMTHTEANMIVDIVIPSLLILALFIGNAFIVLIIYKYRKRKNDDLDDEFNTIPLSVNGNIHSAGNAV